MNDGRTWFDDDGQPVPVVMPEIYGQPDDEPLTTPLQACALRYLLHLEHRPMEVVAAELGVSPQAISAMQERIRAKLGFRRGRKRRTSPP